MCCCCCLFCYIGTDIDNNAAMQKYSLNNYQNLISLATTLSTLSNDKNVPQTVQRSPLGLIVTPLSCSIAEVHHFLVVSRQQSSVLRLPWNKLTLELNSQYWGTSPVCTLTRRPCFTCSVILYPSRVLTGGLILRVAGITTSSPHIRCASCCTTLSGVGSSHAVALASGWWLRVFSVVHGYK